MLQLKLLGASVISVRGEDYTPAAKHLFALMLRLAATPGKPVRREELIQLVYGDVKDEKAASHNTRQLIHVAKSRGVPLLAMKSSLLLDHASVHSDVDDLLAGRLGEGGSKVRNVSILEGYEPRLGVMYAAWLDDYREVLGASVRHHLLDAIDHARSHGDWLALEARARECLSVDPLNEIATLGLAESLANTGSKGRAVTTLNAYQTELDEVDTNISLPAQLLRKRIERHTPSYSDVESRFTGRVAEMTQLHTAWQLALARKPTVCVISGEVGSGKTRMLDEHVAAARVGHGITLVAVSKTSTEPLRPFGYFSDLVPRLLTMPGAAGCDPKLMEFLQRFTDAATTAAGTFHFPGEAEFIAIGVRRAVIDLIAALSFDRPCIFTIDDSRVLDMQSLDTIREMERSGLEVRAQFIITTTDSAPSPELLDAARTLVRLGPLDSNAAAEMVASLDPMQQLTPDRVDWCLAGAGGNPAFLKLLVADALRPGGARTLPHDVVSALDRNLALLSEQAAHVLECCIVLDDHCTPELVSDLVELSTFEVVRALHELENRGHIILDGARILIRSRLVGDRARSAASSTVLTLLHGRAAALLSAVSDPAVPSWTLATHWKLAGKPEKARQVLKECWRESLRLGQPSDAQAGIRAYLDGITDEHQQLDILDDLIELSQANDDATSLPETIAMRGAILVRHGMEDARAETIAFDLVDAGLRSNTYDPTKVDYLLSAASSSQLDERRRSRALFWLMAIADSYFDESLATRAFGILRNCAFHERDAIFFSDTARIIYHGVYGDVEDGFAIVQRLRSALHGSVDWLTIRTLLNVTIADQMFSGWSESIPTLHDLYDRCRFLMNHAMQGQIAIRLASFLLGNGKYDDARRWFDIAQQAGARHSTYFLQLELESTRLSFALLDHDVELINQVMLAQVDNHTTPRMAIKRPARRIQVAHAQGLPAAAHDVEMLREWFPRHCMHNRHDEEMTALWIGLMQQGQSREASDTLYQYMTVHRREVRPAAEFLARLTSADPAWSRIPAHLHGEWSPKYAVAMVEPRT